MSIDNYLKKQIAQLICVEIRMNLLKDKPEEVEKIKNSIKNNQWGSVIFFDGEVESTHQLIKEIQEISEIPLLVCCDLERGAGQHFQGATNIPSNMAIGATKNLDLAYKAGKVTAQEAKEIGINVVFAPSVDVNNNPNNPIINIRSYGENPIEVADMAQAFIQGCQIEGVMATAKHFPGHGDTSADSHIELPVVKKSRKQLEKIELFPFKQVIEDGVDAIMTSHIALPALDETLTPATLSKPIITDLLKKELNFQGLIFTDALNMGGVKNSFEESHEVKAIMAGCDVLLMPPEPEKTVEQIYKAVQENFISPERIKESVDKIKHFKNKYCDLTFKGNLKRVNSEKNKLFAMQVAKDALTKISGNIALPLTMEKSKILNIVIDQDDDTSVWNTLSCQLMKTYKINSFVLSSKVEEQKLQNLSEKITDKDLIIISFFSHIRAWKENMYPDKKVIKWLEKNIIQEKQCIVITFSNPYFIKKLSGVKNYYCTYSSSIESQKAIIEMLFDNLKPQGISPVKLY